MKRFHFLFFLSLAASTLKAQEIKNLTVQTRIDSVYVFGINTAESRSAKGAIWNVKTGKPVTPQNYSKAENDTIDGKPVVKLYRQVVIGNHPLNGWEIWMEKDGVFISIDKEQKNKQINNNGREQE